MTIKYTLTNNPNFSDTISLNFCIAEDYTTAREAQERLSFLLSILDVGSVQRPMKDITPQESVIVCDTCGIALRDDDALKTIREHSKRDMCRTCFMEWYAQQQAGEQA